MKITIRFHEVTCYEATTGPGTDEIYFAAFPTLVRRTPEGGTEQKILRGVLSRVMPGFSPGVAQVLELEGDQSTYWEIDTEDAELLVLNWYLYEEDSGAHWKKLEQDPDITLAQPVSNWGSIADYLPRNLADPLSWAMPVFRLVLNLLCHLLNDDLIEAKMVSIPLGNPSQVDVGEYPFVGDGGKYMAKIEVFQE